MSSAPDLTSRLLRHERGIVAGGVALLAALAWWFIASGAGMDEGGSMAAMNAPPFPALLLMWWLMMAGMMLPSAAPAILLYARVREQRRNRAVAQSWIFLAGYLGVWLLFSIAAALAQSRLTGSSMALENRSLGGAVLVAAGLYQLSPLKSACLRQCRSPAQFISRHWRPGAIGAIRLGMLHGAYCVGCCWMLMALLFVGGVMNLLWVVGLTIIVAAEKLLPRGPLLGRVAGTALVAWGVLRLAGY